jgi:hypothetical protein
MSLYHSGFLYKRKDQEASRNVFTPKTPKTPKPIVHSPLTSLPSSHPTSAIRDTPTVPKQAEIGAWWCELRGTVLKCWSIDASVLTGGLVHKYLEDDEIRNIKAKQSMPNFIQLADACVAVPLKDVIPPSPYAQVPDVKDVKDDVVCPFEHIFKVNSAGQNLHTFLAPSCHFRDTWVAAIRYVFLWESN